MLIPYRCEATHIKWHTYNGPDTVANGLVLEPTMHKLFDAGAWTLTDDRRILVSSEFTGNEETTQRLRSYHKQAIKTPRSEKDLPAVDFIKWHREIKLGGVFRWPPLE